MLNYEIAGEFPDIIYEKSDDGYVARITLNNPETLNTMVRGFGPAFETASNDDKVKVIVIKGAGRALAAGAPLDRAGTQYGWNIKPKKGETPPKPSMKRRLETDKKIFFDGAQKMLLCPKLTVIQAHGYLLGASFDTYLLADFIIASEDCKLGEVEARLGVPGLTITPIMILRCGLTHALDLCLTGRMIDGKEAARIGLINRAVPIEKLEDEVNRYAEGFSRWPADGIAMGKAARHLIFDKFGITTGLTNAYITHTLTTNIHFEPDEFNFFKERRDLGHRDAIHKRNEYYSLLDT